ncbi:DUF502 domain-containing protein [Natronosalvus vescus]|uniref:DUF502 domain-containing protein n=1 Tax=Natronosalvus vescus TaxID=2953881 RepID=UPI002090C3A6|nr:DUF502 domain-containing protein [Natronosalvus vescus]
MKALSSRLRRWFVNGVVITIPIIVTLIVLLVVLEFVLSLLSPVVAGVDYVWANEPPREVMQAVTVGSLIAFFLLVGFAAEYTPGRYLSRWFHRTIETIPGVGTIYTSVRQASNVLVDDDVDQFEDVKLVEFPHQDTYVLGFLTADTPAAIEASVNSTEMQTVMIPLGPNPMTNGFIVHAPADSVYDVDISVEEAVRITATLGVASNHVDEN